MQARNLVYMVQRRERLKKRVISCQQEMLELEATLTDTVEEDDRDTCVEEEGEGREERGEEEEETDTRQSTRLTRYSYIHYVCLLQ